MAVSLKMFLVYIGAFLVAGIVSMVSVKKISNSFAAQGNRPWIFNIVISLFSSGAAFGATWLTQNSFMLYWLFAGLFLFAGFLFVLLIHNKYFKAPKGNRSTQIFAEILYGVSILLLCVIIFSSMQYFLKATDFLYFPTLFSMLFFLLPVLLLHTFNAAYAIPLPYYKSWQFPMGVARDIPDESEGERLYVIGFEIAKKPADKTHAYFRAKAPEYMPLGDLFYFFINDYNDQYSETPIVYATGTEANHWYFRTKRKWLRPSRILLPDKTVRENKIKENTVIICERI